MFVDTHCHLYKEYYDNIDEIIFDSVNNGIQIMINNGCNFLSSCEVLESSRLYSNVYCAIGLHPGENLEEIDKVIELIKENLLNKKMLAIGEIGLDYFYTKENRLKQISVFEKQLVVAEKYNIPVIIHSREATSDTIEILKKYRVRGIIHCFSGSVEVAKEYIKMGFKLGINGVVTYNNCKLIDTIKKIGINNLVFETDCPYLTPVPYRGKKNIPKYIINIVDYLASNLNISKEEL